jgi:hypothetical protein
MGRTTLWNEVIFLGLKKHTMDEVQNKESSNIMPSLKVFREEKYL